MTITGYRIQSADRDVTDLLDPTQQISRSWGSRGDEQPGISVCETIEDLATYLVTAGQGIEFGVGEWVIVELRGEASFVTAHDAEHGERLMHPTEIVSVRPMGDDFYTLIDVAFENLEN